MKIIKTMGNFTICQDRLGWYKVYGRADWGEEERYWGSHQSLKEAEALVLSIMPTKERLELIN